MSKALEAAGGARTKALAAAAVAMEAKACRRDKKDGCCSASPGDTAAISRSISVVRVLILFIMVRYTGTCFLALRSVVSVMIKNKERHMGHGRSSHQQFSACDD
jgi:hypothetical protein